MSSAAMVSLRMRPFGEGEIFGDRRIEMVTHHQHVEMFVDGVARERAASDWWTTAATFFRPATLMMSGAWPPPAPSVWKA